MYFQDNVSTAKYLYYYVFSGYCFLLFQDELSVQHLIDACIVDDNKLYWCVSSPTMKDKPVCSTDCTCIMCITYQCITVLIINDRMSSGIQ